MIRTRGPFSGGPSKATATTLCQKCLKRGHYSYECKASAQERPYAARPSRTQQLANPKLVPKLSSDVPNELLRKKGIADEELARKEEERGRKRAASFDFATRKRSRSGSTTSVSTISTNRSRSISPKRAKLNDADTYHASQQKPQDSFADPTKKRRRSISSSAFSYSSSGSYDRNGKPRDGDEDRNTRRRRSSVSPRPRGRSTGRHRQEKPEEHMNHSPRRKEHSFDRGGRSNRDDDRYDSSYRAQAQGQENQSMKQPPMQRTRKEKSLSPFSKRLALTQAMNMGR